MDYPPDAKIPIYNDKTYVKVLRLPKNINLNFKNTELFSDNKKRESLLDINPEKENNLKKSNNIGASIPNNLFESSIEAESKKEVSPDRNRPLEPNESKQKNTSKMNIINVDAGYGIENIDFNEIDKKLKDPQETKSEFQKSKLYGVFPDLTNQKFNSNGSGNSKQVQNEKANPCNLYLI